MINKDSNVDTRTLDVNAVGGEAHHSDKPLCSFPKEEALESGNAVEGLETCGSNCKWQLPTTLRRHEWVISL